MVRSSPSSGERLPEYATPLLRFLDRQGRFAARRRRRCVARNYTNVTLRAINRTEGGSPQRTCAVSFGPMASRTKRRGALGRSQATPKKTERVPLRARVVRTLRTGRERIQHRLARQSDDVWGVGLLVLAALVALSFFGLSGPIGAGISGTLRFLFGVWAFLVPLAFVTIGLSLVGVWFTEDRARLIAGVAAVFVASLALFHLMTGSLPSRATSNRSRRVAVPLAPSLRSRCAGPSDSGAHSWC